MWYLWGVILGEEPVGEQIKQWRVDQGMTIAEAARAAGITGSIWSRVETGSTPNPLFATIVRMWAGLGAHLEVVAVGPQLQEPVQLPLPPRRRKPDERVHADA